jgi:hypothetical protein
MQSHLYCYKVYTVVSLDVFKMTAIVHTLPHTDQRGLNWYCSCIYLSILISLIMEYL